MKRMALAVVAAACAASATAADAPYRLPSPAFPPSAQITPGGTILALVSSRPSVGDDGAWVKRNRVDLREYNVPGAIGRNLPLDELPGFVATDYRGLRLVRAIRQQRTILLIYGRDFASGRVLVAVNLSGRIRYALDFVNYGRAGPGALVYQELVWAAEAGGTLYVETSHLTYARDSNYRNAYVTAIDLGTRKVRWRSPALVANARRFELYGNLIVSGYGFTAETDYLYLLDRRTGRPIARLLLPTAADYIVRKGSLLHVRTYDHDVIAKLAPA
jgi:hypothetical protein